MKLRTGILTVLLCALGAGAPSAAPAGKSTVTWRGDFEAGLEEAVLYRRPMLVTFYTNWCGWCRKLEGTTFVDPEFVRQTESLVPVRVDGDRERGLASMFRVTGYPTTVILSRRGQEIGRIVGFQPPDAFKASVAAAMSRREPAAEIEQRAAGAPGDPEAQYALGDLYLAVGRHREARDAFERVLALDATPADLREDAALDRALAVYLGGNAGGSLPLFDEFLGAYPKSPRRDQALYFSGRALLEAGRPEDGRARLGEAVASSDLEYIRQEAKRLLPGE